MTPDPTLVAVLVIAVTALAGTIAFLFRYYSKRLKEAHDDQKRIMEAASSERFEFAKERFEFVKERSMWLIERTRFEAVELHLRTEFEAKHRAAVESYARTVQDLHETARTHEDTVRREYLQNMESVSDKAEAAQGKIGAVLEKIYDRFVVAPRRGGSH